MSFLIDEEIGNLLLNRVRRDDEFFFVIIKPGPTENPSAVKTIAEFVFATVCVEPNNNEFDTTISRDSLLLRRGETIVDCKLGTHDASGKK